MEKPRCFKSIKPDIYLPINYNAKALTGKKSLMHKKQTKKKTCEFASRHYVMDREV